MLELRYDLAGALRGVRSVREFESTISEFRRFLGYRIKRYTPLVKDPIAFFSAAWMSKKLGMSVVMLIRHPAAFVSSVKKLNWQHPFSHFLDQKLLMEKMLGPFESEIRAYADRQAEIIDQAILLWRMIHHTVLEYKMAHGDWIFVRHEDLSLDPVREFRILCGQLGLEFSSSTEDAIQNYSGPLNPQDPDAPVGSEDTLKRDSRMNIRNWKNRLSLNEIEKIRNKVEDISRFFYSDSDWK
jgi:hypothetical protein